MATVGGLTAAELLDFLNRLANTDELQTVLIRAGLLRLYGSLLDGVAADSDDPDVNRLLQGIWAMSFLPEGKAEIRRDQKCLDGREKQWKFSARFHEDFFKLCNAFEPTEAEELPVAPVVPSGQSPLLQ